MSTNENGKSSTIAIALGMILLAAVTRIIPHAPNFTAITAVALFAGATLQNRWLGVLVPLVALGLTDLIMQSSSGVLFVYLPYAMIALASFQALQKNKKWLRVGGAAVAASLFFFVVSNFGVWMESGMYSRDLQGLRTCYIMALPFLTNQVVGDLFFSGVMFGLFTLLRSLVADSSRAL